MCCYHSSVYMRTFYTTALGPNPTCEAISPGRNTIWQYLWKMCWFNRMAHIPKKSHQARCLALELLSNSLCGLYQKIWKALVYMNWMESRRRLDKDVTVELQDEPFAFCGRNGAACLIFSTGSSARIWSVFCCVGLSRNAKQHQKDRGIMSRPRQCFLQVSEKSLQQVETFKYLGMVFTIDGSRNK